MTRKLFFITGNPGKAEQLAKYLNLPVTHKDIDLPEIQSTDLHSVVRKKADDAFEITKAPVIVDDVSFSLNSMGKLPGPFIRYFLKELGTDGICKVASVFPDPSAVAEVSIGYCDGKETKVFSGVVEGKISDFPKGDGGFGWDAIFIPQGYEITRAEMNEEDYDKTSPRKAALFKLRKYLERS